MKERKRERKKERKREREKEKKNTERKEKEETRKSESEKRRQTKKMLSFFSSSFCDVLGSKIELLLNKRK